MDLGRQYGPLPLGAWVAVVGGGLGIALYTRSRDKPTVNVEDGSGVPGVGTGGTSTWISNNPFKLPLQILPTRHPFAPA